MNSKSTDDSGIIEVHQELTTAEDNEGSSLESRSERIRRLNRERQRRRRMKLKMSRHDEPTMASEASNVNMNLDNLEAFENANTGHDRASTDVKVETESPESVGSKARASRGRSSRRKKQPSNISLNIEPANQVASDSANNAITEVCHGSSRIATASNELSEATDQLAVLVVASEIEVFGENPNVLNGSEDVDSQGNVSSETGEAKRSTRSRKREDGEDEGRIPRRKRSSTNSEEEITVRREKQRELKRKQKERMTPDQVEALRARYREWRRRRKEVMTSEQLEIIRRGNRERQRRRRERLGVRKRLGSSSSQSRGASEAVLQGLRNMSQDRTASETSTSGESSKGSVSDLMSASGLTIDDKTASNMPVAPGMGNSMASNLPSMVASTLHGTLASSLNQHVATSNVLTASYSQVQTSQPGLSSIPVLGPQGTLLSGMPAGTFFPGVAMPGMQAIFPGMHVPVTGTQAGMIQGSPNQTITTIPISGVPGIQTAQGGFLSGIPVTSTQSNTQGLQQCFQNQSTFPREGQVLHNFQTLLPITPVQASGPGMTFLTQIPYCSSSQLPGSLDPKYTTANQAGAQLQGLPLGAQLIQVPIPVDVAVEEHKSVPSEPSTDQPKVKSKSRGRKRNTSAAEMLASLSNYVPPSSTPMASMLSALASSARDRQSSIPQGTEELVGEGVQNKPQTVVLEATSSPVPTQAQSNTPSQPYNMYMTPQRGMDPHPYTMVRTVVSTMPTHTTVDVNSNNYTLAAMSNGPSSIPHMNTFLTALGSQRPGAQFATVGALKDPSQQLVEAARISVAVSTDAIQKATKGTNTGGTSHPDCHISVGTMTDSLYRSSVATNTELGTCDSSTNPAPVKIETVPVEL